MILYVLCWRWLGWLFSELFGSAALQTHFDRGQPLYVRPRPLPRRGRDLCFGFAQWLVPVVNTLHLKAADMFLCSPVTLDWTQHGSRDSVWPAGGAAAAPSQCVCTILYSLSPCVSPPLCFRAMENSCWCMYFDICTNAPLWKTNETLTYLE